MVEDSAGLREVLGLISGSGRNKTNQKDTTHKGKSHFNETHY